MADCFNHNCPFRINETNNVNRCDSISCPNRCNNIFIISSNRTLTDNELAILEAQRTEDKTKMNNWISVNDEVLYWMPLPKNPERWDK